MKRISMTILAAALGAAMAAPAMLGCGKNNKASEKTLDERAGESPMTTKTGEAEGSDKETGENKVPDQVREDDQKRVRAWLETKELPAILGIWGERKTPEDFALTLSEFSADDELRMRYLAEPESEENRALLGDYKGQELRHLAIEKVVCPTGEDAAGEGGDEEEMECYDPVFFMTLDASGKVIALWGTAAG